MRSFLAAVAILVCLSSISSSNPDAKCSVWFLKPPNLEKCCQIPQPIDFPTLEPFFKEMRAQNASECEFFKKLTEKLELTKYDKAIYKSYLKKVIKDPDWKPIYKSNVDSCIDLVPKISALYAKKRNMENCDFKFSLTMSCLVIQGYSACPAKYFNEAQDCKDLKAVVRECAQKHDAIINSLNSMPN